VADQVIALD